MQTMGSVTSMTCGASWYLPPEWARPSISVTIFSRVGTFSFSWSITSGAKLVVTDVVEERGEHGQQNHVHVVQGRGAPGDGALHVTEALLDQVLHHLGQVVGGVVEERQQVGPDELGAVLYHRP
ncbi:hypothetical protein EGW08_022230, partial [Elysia chlorotica]